MIADRHVITTAAPTVQLDLCRRPTATACPNNIAAADQAGKTETAARLQPVSRMDKLERRDSRKDQER
jgi:hypothetical protein